MSKETLEWLNDNVLFGYTATRSTWSREMKFSSLDDRPWFATDDYDGAFSGPVPVDEVRDRLFYWQATSVDLTVRIPCDLEVADGVDDEGAPYRNMVIPDKQAILRPDTAEVLGVFGRDSYKIHQFDQWLIENVGNLLDGELGISSAGLLRGGAQAWVSIELPDDVEVTGAGHIRPCIIAATSHDGSLATTYATRLMRPECDNSLHWSLGRRQQGGTHKVKHSSRSLGQLNTARDALGIVFTMTEQAEQHFAALADVDVTDNQFRQIVKSVFPTPDPVLELNSKGKQVVKNQRSINKAEDNQGNVMDLWRTGPEAAPWQGTLAGAYHAVNTFNEHQRSRDDIMLRRQIKGSLDGSFDQMDRQFWSIVEGMVDEGELAAPAELVAVK